MGSASVTKPKKHKKWYKKKYTVIDIAKKAWAGVNYIKDMINCEAHMVDVTQNGVSVDYDGALVHLSPVTQGDTRNARSGKSILAKYLSGRIQLAITSSQRSSVRLIIFMDTQNNGTAPAVSDILENTGTALGPLSSLKQLQNGRFKILWSRLITLDGVKESLQDLKYYLPLKRQHLYFDGATSADYQKNAIFMLQISSAATASNPPTISSYQRFSFYDN